MLTKEVTVMLDLPTGHQPHLRLPDRHPGVISFKGEQITMIPHIAASGQEVELSIYKGGRSERAFVRSMSLPVTSGKSAAAKPVRMDIGFMPGIAVAALWPRDMHYMGSPEGDCKVECCWGGFIEACAACCDPKKPSCGVCCDSGCCPPPCDPPA
jgi:hypothetical protein